MRIKLATAYNDEPRIFEERPSGNKSFSLNSFSERSSVNSTVKTASTMLNKHKMTQVFRHLIQNAIKFSEYNGKMEVNLRLIPNKLLHEGTISLVSISSKRKQQREQRSHRSNTHTSNNNNDDKETHDGSMGENESVGAAGSVGGPNNTFQGIEHGNNDPTPPSHILRLEVIDSGPGIDKVGCVIRHINRLSILLIYMIL